MSVNIKHWDVEDQSFWESTGKKIANKNLWISIPALLLAFAVWIMWGMLITYLQDFGFHFGLITPEMSPEEVAEQWVVIKSMYYTLPAIAGLAGATLRIPNSFLIAISGGRNVIFVTTLLLLIPVVGVGMALGDVNTPYLTFVIFAALSGIGGGNFASSMNNISFFFPKSKQGTALGLNAGIGNLGVGTMQLVIPWVVGFALFGAIGHTGEVSNMIPLKDGVGPIAGIQNAAWVWAPLLAIFGLAAFFGMNNVSTGTPKLPNTLSGVSKTFSMLSLGLIPTALGVYLLIRFFNVGLPFKLLILLVVIVLTLLLMKFLSPRSIRDDLNKQFAIFDNKHTWVMTIIYTMTFGSFIGFSMAFPKISQDIFDVSKEVDPNAPNYKLWYFFGPALGALIRPVGGWLSDRFKSGSMITAISTLVQILATIAVAIFVIKARNSADPSDYWWPYFFCFMVLFMTTGIGNGSTFRSIPYIFNKAQAGPVLGWTSAIAAYGAFIIPMVFKSQIKAGTPELALYGFAIYYGVCFVLNWWYYLGPKAEFKRP